MIIYKVTNALNNKAYIGLTKFSLEKRRYQHFNDAFNDSQLYFHKALRKYGQDVWNWEIIAERDNREEASNTEIQLIKEHRTFINGYNSTSGGVGNWIVTNETRKRMSEAKLGTKQTPEANAKRSLTLKGRTHSEEAKKRMSMAMKGKTSPMKGKHHSIETRRKMSESQKGRRRPCSIETRRKISKSLKARARA